MKLLKTLCIGLVFCLSFLSCENREINSDVLEISGTIKPQGITTYQYGTHTISGYALRSSTVTLDDYVDQEVVLIGHKINGYPVEGGPDYIEVEKIK